MVPDKPKEKEKGNCGGGRVEKKSEREMGANSRSNGGGGVNTFHRALVSSMGSKVVKSIDGRFL